MKTKKLIVPKLPKIDDRKYMSKSYITNNMKNDIIYKALVNNSDVNYEKNTFTKNIKINDHINATTGRILKDTYELDLSSFNSMKKVSDSKNVKADNLINSKSTESENFNVNITEENPIKSTKKDKIEKVKKTNNSNINKSKGLLENSIIRQSNFDSILNAKIDYKDNENMTKSNDLFITTFHSIMPIMDKNENKNILLKSNFEINSDIGNQYNNVLDYKKKDEIFNEKKFNLDLITRYKTVFSKDFNNCGEVEECNLQRINNFKGLDSDWNKLMIKKRNHKTLEDMKVVGSGFYKKVKSIHIKSVDNFINGLKNKALKSLNKSIKSEFTAIKNNESKNVLNDIYSKQITKKNSRKNISLDIDSDKDTIIDMRHKKNESSNKSLANIKDDNELENNKNKNKDESYYNKAILDYLEQQKLSDSKKIDKSISTSSSISNTNSDGSDTVFELGPHSKFKIKLKEDNQIFKKRKVLFKKQQYYKFELMKELERLIKLHLFNTNKDVNKLIEFVVYKKVNNPKSFEENIYSKLKNNELYKLRDEEIISESIVTQNVNNNLIAGSNFNAVTPILNKHCMIEYTDLLAEIDEKCKYYFDIIKDKYTKHV